MASPRVLPDAKVLLHILPGQSFVPRPVPSSACTVVVLDGQTQTLSQVAISKQYTCTCVCVCVCERERERERERELVCVCVCARARAPVRVFVRACVLVRAC
jgi:hypothetical protein